MAKLPRAVARPPITVVRDNWGTVCSLHKPIDGVGGGVARMPVSGATAAMRAGESKLLVVASFYPSGEHLLIAGTDPAVGRAGLEPSYRFRSYEAPLQLHNLKCI